MRHVLFFLVFATLAACATTKPTMTTCSLDEENFAKRKDLFAPLMSSASEKAPISGGYAIMFPSPKQVGEITKIIELEQSCCPFLSFRLDVPAGETVRLEITGPADAQPLIKELVIHPSGQRNL